MCSLSTPSPSQNNQTKHCVSPLISEKGCVLVISFKCSLHYRRLCRCINKIQASKQCPFLKTKKSLVLSESYFFLYILTFSKTKTTLCLMWLTSNCFINCINCRFWSRPAVHVQVPWNYFIWHYTKKVRRGELKTGTQKNKIFWWIGSD